MISLKRPLFAVKMSFLARHFSCACIVIPSWVSLRKSGYCVRKKKKRMAIPSHSYENLSCGGTADLGEMTQLHSNLLKVLLTKKYLKLSTIKTRKLREALKKLHEDTARLGCRETRSYFGVPLHVQQQVTSNLTNNPVPYILESITAYLLRHVVQEGILRKCGNERRANALKDLIDSNHGVIPQNSEYSIHDVTCVLKRWLRALPEAVIPEVLHEVFIKCVELESHHHRTQGLLIACLLLPTFHLNTLKHVAVFLQEISKQEAKNKMTSANLAKVLAPSLMPCTIKAETNTDQAKRFNDLSTTAVQVLIDHAHLISSLPSELEPAKDTYKTVSEDEFSDHGEGHVKRKLFTFLKPKNVAHKGVSRTSSIMRPSRKVVQPTTVPVKRPNSTNADSSTSDDVDPKTDVRVTRSTSKKRQLSAETVKSIRERRALKAIQNIRNQSAVRSLPIINGNRRRSVRRAATCRSDKRPSSPSSRRVLRSDNVKQSEGEKVPKKVPSNKCDGDAVIVVAASAATVHRLVPLTKTETISTPDRETARKSFLATMIGETSALITPEPSIAPDNRTANASIKLSTEADEENLYMAPSVACVTISGSDLVDGEPGCLDRHGAFRKPLILSNKRALRRELPVNRLTATITVQL